MASRLETAALGAAIVIGAGLIASSIEWKPRIKRVHTGSLQDAPAPRLVHPGFQSNAPAEPMVGDARK